MTIPTKKRQFRKPERLDVGDNFLTQGSRQTARAIFIPFLSVT
jgi:hypothetical protein